MRTRSKVGVCTRHGGVGWVGGLMVLICGVAVAQAPATSCADAAGRDTLALWLGEWQLLAGAGAAERVPLGSSEVRPVAGGCAFAEHRDLADGSSEEALIFFDPAAAGGWRQTWVSSEGHSGSFELEVEPGRVAITGELQLADGSRVPIKASLVTTAEGMTGRVQTSLDGGVTFAPETVTSYRRPGAAGAETMVADAPVAPTPSPTKTATDPPSPTQPSAPQATVTPQISEAQEALETGAVKVQSQRKGRVVETIEFESPMTLEFELGPLDVLPAGAGWRTIQLAGFSTDSVSVPQVTVNSRERRSRVQVEVTVNLLTSASSRKVDLTVELLSGGSAVTSATVGGVKLGRLITAQDSKSGLPVVVKLELAPDEFAALFAGGKRPSARITVAVE